MKKTVLNYISVILAFAVMLCGFSFSAFAVQTQEESWELEEQLLGTVSAKYESNGDPASISSGAGDSGGASYGAYQFSSYYGVPLNFAKWLVSSGIDASIGNRLINAYYADENKYSSNFNATWKAIAQENRDYFLKLQHNYIKYAYYDDAVNRLVQNLKFDINAYSIALKNALWSRAVQHGAYMASVLFSRVNDALPNGLFGATELEIIIALYKESGLAIENGNSPMHAANSGSNSWIVEKYGLENLTMKYYGANSSAVQAGVWLRLNVNELNDLIEMYNKYGNNDPSIYSAFTKASGGQVSVDITDVFGNPLISVPEGYPVTVMGAAENGMLPISINYLGNEYSGYCKEENISRSMPSYLRIRFGHIANATTSVNIRSLPTTDSAILTSVNVNKGLRITGPENNGWYPVQLWDGNRKITGFCYGQYVEIENEGREYMLGDINLDGKITPSDALTVLQESVGKISVEAVLSAVSDVDFSNEVTTLDALLVLQYSVGIRNGF